MTFRSLALSNVRGNWRAYSAFFLSSVFSVMIFYIYAAFIYHPDVVSGQILSALKVRTGMMFCLYIIIIFSFLFILYSNSAFLKTRKQEFGLFSLFGMTRSQLRKLVIYENMAISVMAIGVGLGLGLLFSKLFFMALGALLEMKETISFAVPAKAVWMTSGGFFVLFMVISAWTVIRMRKTEIIELLTASRKPKGKLVYSRWLVALAAACLVSGYAMAVLMNAGTFVLLSLPILATVVVGTYFLFTQLSILLIGWFQKRTGIYYKKTNMLIFAQLGYKIRDNARILFVVSILSAVILTAMGTVYIMQIQGKQDMMENSPYTLAYVEKGLHAEKVIDQKKLRGILKDDGYKITKEAKVIGIALEKYHLTFEGESMELGRDNWDDVDFSMSAFIMSASDYNKLAKEQGQPAIEAESGKLTVAYPHFYNKTYGSGTASGLIGGEKVELPVAGTVSENIANNWIDSNAVTIVMDDLSFVNLIAKVPEEEQRVFYGFELSGWEKSAPTVEKLTALVPEEMSGEKDFSRAESFASMNVTISLTLFIGLFISLLFFIAAGSMIYFKLFTELQEDQTQYKGLARIGMTRKEIRRIVVSQIAIVFFIPCIVGIIHALFAMVSLDNMMGSSNWLYSFVVIGIYIVMQTLYFLLASGTYMKSMLKGTAVS
ncbi:ABC transporter permease [Paenibacillus sp. LHD-117]|uniref:ABC transporter permease n=1 Tax=Paenibacillus sp. LHD-117 TaxID=3071412 RepID=UPI0027DFBEB2|nr:ABC transporter permease [Paenibacillus sp. LHD-117]MDQ6419858.1 ABC transporter permease [Paenibacillus sp. LHD-117]